jgi:integrase
MASLQRKSDTFYCQFCYLGKRYTVTVGKVSQDEANAFAGSVDLILLRLKQKLLSMPPGVSITDFVIHGGKVPEAVAAAPEKTTFADFKKRYLDTFRDGAMEANSLDTVAMHLGHFEMTLGPAFVLQELTLADLQRHVNRRREKKYRGKRLSPVTLKKEIASLRAAWNWAAHMSLVKGLFPSRGLVFPKTDEKPPFMTWAEIERRLTAKMTPAQKAELWDCLYLTQPEIADLLECVRQQAGHGWIYPLFCFAGYTGARRSEMLRVLVSDVDFEAMTVVIREKKRSRKQRTTRRVPLTPFLAAVLKTWLAEHPGGPFLFCHTAEVLRSKKRSRTTGHQGDKDRSTTTKGRMATVQARTMRPGQEALTKDEVHDHFKRTLASSKWAVVPGWHCFRHSFISLCASKGVDQRLIDEWVGHQTDEQRKRYRHLLPSTQQQAIRSVFGGG